MSTDFSGYLYNMILIACFLAFIIMLIVLKIKKRTRSIGKLNSIMAGSVSAFFDREGNVTIIAYIKDKFGVGRATGNPLYLNYPYTAGKLGELLRQSMKLCEGGVPCSDNDLMSNLGYKGWKEFTEGRRNISVHYQVGYGIVFNTTIRKPEGSYQFNNSSFENILKHDVEDKELGQNLINLLPRCRG